MPKTRKRAEARAVPKKPVPPPQFPDFIARLKRIHGDKVLKVTGAQLIRKERDRGY
jgi:hypothetical protein